MKFSFGFGGGKETTPNAIPAAAVEPTQEIDPDAALAKIVHEDMLHNNIEDAIRAVQEMLLPDDRDAGYADIAQAWVAQGGSFSEVMKILSFVENQQMRDAVCVRIAAQMNQQGRDEDAAYFVRQITDLGRQQSLATQLSLDLEEFT